MHPILANHDAMKSLDAERDRIDAERREAEATSVQAMENYRHVLATAALGDPMPPMPVSVAEIGQHHRAQVDMLDQRRRAWMGEKAEELIDAAYRREDEVIAQAAELLAELDGLAIECAALAQVVKQAHEARHGGHYFGTGPTTLGTLLSAARQGVQLLREPLAIDPRLSTFIEHKVDGPADPKPMAFAGNTWG